MLVRVVDGALKPKDRILLMSSGAMFLCEQVGVFTPKAKTKDGLAAGEVGYVTAGIKELKAARVGDTVTLVQRPAAQALPDLASRISVVPYGVDLVKFDPQRVAAERVIALSQLWRLPDDKPVIMLPGRYAPQKGHALLLEALHLMRGIDFRCVILGPSADGGAYRDQLERLAENLGLSDRVLLADECRDMPAALMLADLVVAPYLTPSVYNRVALEAQALGRPVATTDFPTAREVVEGSSMAWLFPPNDAGGLANAIAEAIALPWMNGTAERPR
jgi:glycosyltransferase involved in cell wall biosynthesis